MRKRCPSNLSAHLRVGDAVVNMAPPTVYLVLALTVVVMRSGEYGLGKHGLKGIAKAH
jgi:hypothetical protein